MTFSNRVIISQAKKASLASPPTHIGWAVGIILLVLFDIDGSSFGNDYASIAPILQHHCVQCHGSTQREAGLRLDRAALLLAGGENGPVVLRKNSAASELVRRIRSAGDDRMPPEGPGLSEEEQKIIANWIDTDLPGLPANEAAPDTDPRLQHWAWRPIQRPQLPEIQANQESDFSSLARNAIDRFVLAQLQQQGLQPAPLAPLIDRMRRLSYDLRGLPLAPAEWKDLISNQQPGDPYAQAVDRFLGDSAYGEKWARHWLDIAHYADTHGFERDQRRPNAWRYRDYVIDSLNGDLPYHQFVQQQIAGDILQPEDPAAVVATGFLAAGPYDFVGQEETRSEVLRRQARADDLDDLLTQVMTSLCGVTIHCARCHDHKLDPITQKEYYEMVALFAALRRADRPVDDREQQAYLESQTKWTQHIATLRSELGKLRNQGLNLADLIGGGTGFGTGKPDSGYDPTSGKIQIEKRGFLEKISLNQYYPIAAVGLDGIAVPDGKIDGAEHRLIVSSTGIEIPIPDTSGAAWDAVRNGPVNSLYSTSLDGVDYATGHAMLGTHANVAISFDLTELRQASQQRFTHFRSGVGYFGQTETRGASVSVFLDGMEVAKYERIGRLDGLKSIDIPLQHQHRFLTLLITDAGNGIAHDQVCFIDPVLTLEIAKDPTAKAQAESAVRIKQLLEEIEEAELAEKQLSPPKRFYGITAGNETSIFRLRRGNPEDPLEAVQANTIRCLPLALDLPASAAGDKERRKAFAKWLADPANPLVARVIVNRIWHYHFGRGLVETPSDFGLGGSPPSHPELLDWLAAELVEHDWSLKHIQRLICHSHTYQQSSQRNEAALAKDRQNVFLWRRSPKRLDAEALRDSILSLSDCIDRRFHGPGYEDFEYQEEYAPVYRYIPANKPELWRRSIYRYIVRTTTHQFLATLDCPNAANLTPVRDHTTTPLQALALLNNDFMRDQARRFAERLRNECGDDTNRQVELAFELAFARLPSPQEKEASLEMIQQSNVAAFCLMLFNANEFIFLD